MCTVLPAGSLRDASAVIDTLTSHRDTLEKLAVTTRDLEQEPLSVGLRLLLNAYAQILDDGLSVLNSIIAHLERDQTVHG